MLGSMALGQAENYTMTVEEYAVDGIAGQTTYRLYIDMVNPDDFLSSAYGNVDDPFSLTTTTSFYNDAAATGGSAGGVNPSFLVPPFSDFFPGLGYDSWFTIGIEYAPSGAETAISAVESAAQPWIGCFDATSAIAGQNVFMDDITGGAWYVLNGTPNGLPDAENQRVLFAQLTTDGELCGVVNVQIFENGTGTNDVRPRFEFCGTGTFSHTVAVMAGCTDETACNYDADATDDDGSCTYAEAGYDCEGVCLNDADEDGTCDEFEIAGCQDEAACNYDATATDAGNCTYAEAGYDCEGNCLVDTDMDGVCDEFEIAGCEDETACNYNSEATDNDGSCTYADAGYDCDGACLNDADGDGICDEFEVVGCQDNTACNYDATATDAGDCVYATGPCDVCDGMGGVTDNDQDDDGICDADETSGCTEMDACNYNPNVTDDDGSCVFATENCEVCMGGMVVLQDADGDGVCDGDEIAGCTDMEACNYDETATDDDGSCAEEDALGVCGGDCAVDSNGNGVCDNDEVIGCTDETACNYDPAATFDPLNSCEYMSCQGCTDAMACNYDETATQDDGSCVFADGACESCNAEGGVDVSDADGDGVCDSDEITGCQDMMACNYDETATDAGDCVYADGNCEVCDGNGGVTIQDADEDGICDGDEIVGCQDMMACNYDGTATDAGDCVYADGNCEVCDGNGGVEVQDADEDGICDGDEIVGCQDMMACNYDETATDAGDCVYADGNCEICDGNGGVEVQDADGDGICDGDEVAGCTDAEACNYNMEATDDDGSCEYPEEFYDCNGDCVNDTDGDGVCDELEISGCTDPEAYNYNEEATDDDGSCAYCDLTIVVDQVEPDMAPGFAGEIAVTVNGATGELTYAWTGPNGYTSDAEDIVGLEAGTYNLVVTDENGCEASVEVEVDFLDQIQELSLLTLSAFPNPAHDHIVIASPEFAGTVRVQLFDGAGRKVMDTESAAAAGQVVVPVNGVATGTYFLSVHSAGLSGHQQIMIAH